MKYLKIIIACLVFGLLFWLIDFQELLHTLQNLTPSLACLLMLISFVMIYVSSLKWGLFLSATGIQVALSKLYRFYLLSYFINLLLPSFVGGDLARSILITDKQNRSESLAATFMERLSGLIAMLFLALIMLPWIPIQQSQIAYTLILISVILGLIIFFSLKLNFDRFTNNYRMLTKFALKIRSFQEAVRLLFRKRQLLIQTMGLSFLFHCLTVLNTLAAAWAVGWWDAPVLQLFIVLPLILLISAIPITPNGLGLQEGAFFYFLTLLGATPEQALGLGLVLRAKSYILAIIGGVIFSRLKKTSPTLPTT